MHTIQQTVEATFDVVILDPRSGVERTITTCPTLDEASAIVSYLNGGLSPQATANLNRFVREVVGLVEDERDRIRRIHPD